MEVDPAAVPQSVTSALAIAAAVAAAIGAAAVAFVAWLRSLGLLRKPDQEPAPYSPAPAPLDNQHLEQLIEAKFTMVGQQISAAAMNLGNQISAVALRLDDSIETQRRHIESDERDFVSLRQNDAKLFDRVGELERKRA